MTEVRTPTIEPVHVVRDEPPDSGPTSGLQAKPSVDDPSSFEEVYDLYFHYVWRTARRLGIGLDAIDDLVQETFLVVHRRLDEPRTGSLRAWLYGITVYTARNHRRSLRRKSPHHAGAATDPDSLESAVGDPEAAARAREAARALHAVLDTLDEPHREVFVLVELEQLSVPEVATIVDAKLNTVYSRLRRAREAFDDAARKYRAESEGRNP